MFSIDVTEARNDASSLELVADALDSVYNSLAGVDVTSFMSGSVGTSINSNIRKVEAVAAAKRKDIANLAQALSRIADSYEQAEDSAKSEISSRGMSTSVVMTGGANLAATSGVFDKKGGYGGDQGDLQHHQSGIKLGWWRFWENGELFDAVRQYPGYENYTDDQIAKLFKQINSEGCGYVAVVNSLFMQYESDPAEFERVFGFPMYDEKGEFNFNRFIIDFYCSTDDRYYLNEDNGLNAVVVDVLNSYKDHPDDFVRKYGMQPFADEDHYNPAAMQAVANDYQNRNVVARDEAGTTLYSLDNRLSHYLDSKNVNYTSDSHIYPMNTSDVRKALKNGECVNIATGDFNLYNKYGWVVKPAVGDHWMTITGVTKDGNYIVSSWGNKYYIHPNELPRAEMLVVDVK